MSDLLNFLHAQKRYPKTFGEDKKPMRDQTSTYFYLFIISITLTSTEKLGGLGREGGWGWVGVRGVE